MHPKLALGALGSAKKCGTRRPAWTISTVVILDAKYRQAGTLSSSTAASTPRLASPRGRMSAGLRRRSPARGPRPLERKNPDPASSVSLRPSVPPSPSLSLSQDPASSVSLRRRCRPASQRSAGSAGLLLQRLRALTYRDGVRQHRWRARPQGSGRSAAVGSGPARSRWAVAGAEVDPRKPPRNHAVRGGRRGSLRARRAQGRGAGRPGRRGRLLQGPPRAPLCGRRPAGRNSAHTKSAAGRQIPPGRMGGRGGGGCAPVSESPWTSPAWPASE